MTKDEILALKPGRELDLLIMDNVFGYKNMITVYSWADRKKKEKPMNFLTNSPKKVDLGDYGTYFDEQGNKIQFGNPVRLYNPKTYSIDIVAAWEVVEKLKKQYQFLLFKPIDEPYQASFVPNEYYIEHGDHYIDDYFERYEGNTAPEAICKAALIEIMQSQKRLAVME